MSDLNDKRNKIINIIFLVVFFFLLFLPLFCFNSTKSYNPEERYAYWYPVLDKKGNFDKYFGKNFDDLIKFKFFMRKEMINLFCTLPLKLFGRNERGVYDKTSGDLYFTWEFIEPHPSLVEQRLAKLYYLNNFCLSNNIKLYALIAPQKPRFYPSNLGIYKKFDWHERAMKTIDDMNKNGNVKIIYPYYQFMESKDKKRLYFKTDSHWTDDGAYIAYRTLMAEIKQDFPQAKILQPNDFEYFYNKKIRTEFDRKFFDGRSGYSLGISVKDIKKLHTFPYRYYRYKDYDSMKVKITDNKFRRSKDFRYPKANNLKVLMLGTSQAENLAEFIPFSFGQVRTIRINIGNSKIFGDFKIIKRYQKEILEYKPDIIIFCFTYNNMYELAQIDEMD